MSRCFGCFSAADCLQDEGGDVAGYEAEGVCAWPEPRKRLAEDDDYAGEAEVD